jgi:hypothetical protein
MLPYSWARETASRPQIPTAASQFGRNTLIHFDIMRLSILALQTILKRKFSTSLTKVDSKLDKLALLETKRFSGRFSLWAVESKQEGKSK